jgi:hypothetical protein
MFTVEPDDNEHDYSSLVSFSKAYALAAKQAQSAEGVWPEERWRRRVFETVWRGICRQARRTGLNEAEAGKIAEEIVIAAMRRLNQSHDVMTVAIFRRQLWNFARRYFAWLTSPKCDTGPYYASVAWRKKHIPPD